MSFENEAIPVNSRPHVGLNPDPLERFSPAFLVTARRLQDRTTEHIPEYARGADLRLLREVPLCPSEYSGIPRFVLAVYRIRGEGKGDSPH